jgi:ribose transport system permease protein
VTTAGATEALRRPPEAWRRATELQARFPILQLLVLLAVYAFGAATLDGLSSTASIKLILIFAALASLAALGQTLLILMGGFDLSIPGIMAASGLVVTQLRETWGVSFPVALLIAIVAAAALGALAGQICHRLDIQPLVVTLATGAIAVGLAQTQVPEGEASTASAPAWLIELTSPTGTTFGVEIPPVVVIWVVVAILATIFFHRTAPGRRLLATGANPLGAEYSLIRTGRVWTLAFAFSAVVSALVGLLVAGLSGQVTIDSGNEYLFLSVVAVIVGGTIFGGPGDYLRTCLGALLVTVVGIVLIGHGASESARQIVFGVAVLLSVSLYGRQRRLRDRV